MVPKIINIPFYYLPITQKYFKQNIFFGVLSCKRYYIRKTLSSSYFTECRVEKAEAVPTFLNYLTISKTLAKSSSLQSAVKEILNLEVPSGTVGGRIAGI